MVTVGLFKVFEIVLGGTSGWLGILPHQCRDKAPERLEQVIVKEILGEIRDIPLEPISERN